MVVQAADPVYAQTVLVLYRFLTVLGMTWNAIERTLPIPHGSVELSIHRQICPLVRKFLCKLFVVIDSQPGLIAGMQVALFKIIGMRENFVGLFGVPHVLLESEVGNRDIEVQSRG